MRITLVLGMAFPVALVFGFTAVLAARAALRNHRRWRATRALPVVLATEKQLKAAVPQWPADSRRWPEPRSLVNVAGPRVWGAFATAAVRRVRALSTAASCVLVFAAALLGFQLPAFFSGLGTFLVHAGQVNGVPGGAGSFAGATRVLADPAWWSFLANTLGWFILLLIGYMLQRRAHDFRQIARAYAARARPK